MSPDHKFPARLRIKSQKQIELLIAESSSLFSHPLILKYHFTKLPDAHIASPQLAISVPKRLFKKAHDRNLIKRRIREVYRICWKEYLPESGNVQVLMLMVLIGKVIPEYSDLEKAIHQLLKKLAKLNP
ncbi:MAG: ribonuclease P protein component [Saprospiraceae bacterium]|nr:ribonuclease P protein component [Saprospiraceae bacterium]HRG67260.1 ribonuclease P protein component [Saprospiraceae bacterium]